MRRRLPGLLGRFGGNGCGHCQPLRARFIRPHPLERTFRVKPVGSLGQGKNEELLIFVLHQQPNGDPPGLRNRMLRGSRVILETMNRQRLITLGARTTAATMGLVGMFSVFLGRKVE